MQVAAYIFLGILAAVAPVVTAIVLLRKAPAETQKISVETVDVNVTYAGRVRDLAVADWERVSRELDELRGEFDTYRRETSDEINLLNTELRGRTAENEALAAENERLAAENVRLRSIEDEAVDLRRRVDELETEVRALKAGRKS